MENAPICHQINFKGKKSQKEKYTDQMKSLSACLLVIVILMISFESII